MMQHTSELQDAILKLSTWLTAQEVLSNLGRWDNEPESLTYMWKESGKIFTLSVNRHILFPAYALGVDGRPLPVIRHILTEFSGKRNALAIACWFASTNSWLGGMTPMDIISKHEDAVLYAAKIEIALIEHG